MVYPYRKYCAYSTNTTHQSLIAVKDERIEVFDQVSHVLRLSACNPSTDIGFAPEEKTIMRLIRYSRDGKTLYFCLSTAEPIPSGYKDIKYNICKIGFDAATGKFWQQVDIIFKCL